jgi:hypothetical protein
LNGWARKYDLDHERFLVFFGTIGLLDWIHSIDGKESIVMVRRCYENENENERLMLTHSDVSISPPFATSNVEKFSDSRERFSVWR